MLNVFYTLFLIAMIFIATVVVLSKFETPLNYRLFNITSGSMSPTIPTGSVVVVTAENNYKKEDVISFVYDRDVNNVITHRIKEISKDDELNLTAYVTKGDANEDTDTRAVIKDNVIGKVIFTIPYIGYPVQLAKTQLGFIFLIVIPATIIIYSELNSIKNEFVKWFKSKKQNKTENDES